MLNRQNRFHGHNALNFAHKQGKVVRGAGLNLKYIKNDRRDTYRVSVVVSKKVSKSAVVRNRIRRRIYEAVRLQAAGIKDSYDLVFVVFTPDLAVMESDRLQKLIAGQLRQAAVVL